MSLEKILTKRNSELSKEIDKKRIPDHVAIIMDGNGRWATKKGLPRSYGHNQGVNVLKEILKASKNLGCKILTTEKDYNRIKNYNLENIKYIKTKLEISNEKNLFKIISSS